MSSMIDESGAGRINYEPPKAKEPRAMAIAHLIIGGSVLALIAGTCVGLGYLAKVVWSAVF